MIITCKPHGANLIGASKFRNEPKKALGVYQTLLPLWGGVWGSGRDYNYSYTGIGLACRAAPRHRLSAAGDAMATVVVITRSACARGKVILSVVARKSLVWAI